jgi:hypothetical protein
MLTCGEEFGGHYHHSCASPGGVGHVTCHTIPKKKEKRTRVPTGHCIDSLPTQGFRVLSNSFLFSLKKKLVDIAFYSCLVLLRVGQHLLDAWFFGSGFCDVSDGRVHDDDHVLYTP